MKENAGWLQVAAAVVTLASVLVGAGTTAIITWRQLDVGGRVILSAGLALALYGAYRFGSVRPRERRLHRRLQPGEPDASLMKLAQQVLETREPWCATPKATEQGGIALGLLLTWQLLWRLSNIEEHLSNYVREWQRESKVGQQSVTRMFYEIARRASIDMMKVPFHSQCRALINGHPELDRFCHDAHGIVVQFRDEVERPLCLAQIIQNPADVQRSAAETVEELSRKAADLRDRVEAWQRDAKAEAADLRSRLLVE